MTVKKPHGYPAILNPENLAHDIRVNREPSHLLCGFFL